MSAPTLKSQRLTLRVPVMADASAHRDFYASKHSAAIGGPLSTSDAWRMFSSHVGHWTLKGFGWFILEDETGPCGMVGVHQPPYYEAMELGWALFEDATGKGYATEAATTIRAWAIETLDPPRLVSFIAPANIASQAVARRLGASTDGARAVHNKDCEVWTHPLGRADL